jgi:lipoprotein-anchoring transpeptidase ErfK/SrfK
MRTSSRTRRILALPIAALAAIPVAPASARIIEVGKIAQDNVPSCPSTPCQAVSKTTGYQAKVGTTRALFAVPADGKIVAWTITLGKPGPTQIRFFNDNYGGAARAGISVLKPGSKLFGRVTGQSPLQSLQPYFGQTVQFPLARALNVKKGYVVALTVPSWAPALSLGMGNDTSWRASRARGGCDETDTQTAQLRLAGLAQYFCLYRTARLTYSATLITTPKPPR